VHINNNNNVVVIGIININIVITIIITKISWPLLQVSSAATQIVGSQQEHVYLYTCSVVS